MAPFLTVALTGVLAGATFGGRVALILAVLVVQAACVFGWFGAIPVRGGPAAPIVALLAAIGADVAILTSSDHQTLGPVAGVLGCTVVAAMAAQLIRHGDRTDMTTALAATVAAATFAAAGVAYLPTLALASGRDLVLIALAVVAACGLPFALPGPIWLRGALGLVVGVGIAAIVGATDSALGSGTALAVGGVATCLAVVTRAGIRGAAGNGKATALLEGALPVLVIAPAVYVVGSVLVT